LNRLYKLVAVNRKDYILALLYSNTIFYLTSIKPFYIKDIKVIINSPESEPVSEFYNKAKGNTGIISPTISAILLKYSRGYPYKNPDFIVFL
jgi:hypothetical protein